VYQERPLPLSMYQAQSLLRFMYQAYPLPLLVYQTHPLPPLVYQAHSLPHSQQTVTVSYIEPQNPVNASLKFTLTLVKVIMTIILVFSSLTGPSVSVFRTRVCLDIYVDCAWHILRICHNKVFAKP
jgi:hypothetical protein